MDLQNDTVINVAALLREPIGATRTLELHLVNFPLDDDGLAARNLDGLVRLTRLSDEILTSITGETLVELECQRCLEQYDQPVTVKFSEEFRIAYDVRTGLGMAGETEEDQFEISAAHELDFAEALRQEILIELPMRPSCGERCPGPPSIGTADDNDEVDERFAALSALLEDE
ncbi:MAG: DUF177 domain-containing protein [Thermomicrobiales bacterium]